MPEVLTPRRQFTTDENYWRRLGYGDVLDASTTADEFRINLARAGYVAPGGPTPEPPPVPPPAWADTSSAPERFRQVVPPPIPPWQQPRELLSVPARTMPPAAYQRELQRRYLQSGMQDMTGDEASGRVNAFQSLTPAHQRLIAQRERILPNRISGGNWRGQPPLTPEQVNDLFGRIGESKRVPGAYGPGYQLRDRFAPMLAPDKRMP